MSTAIMDRERIYKYESKQDVIDVLAQNDLGLDDSDYLSAIQIPVGITEIQGVATAMSLPTKSLRLYYIEDGPTGFFQPRGGERMVFLNSYDMIDYDTVSELHTVPDADAYLALTEPWEKNIGAEFDRINEWYRDETYPDHFKAGENEKGGKR